MKIYIVERIKFGLGWNEGCSYIVIAKDFEDAKSWMPDGTPRKPGLIVSDTVEITELGVARPDIKPGVVNMKFNKQVLTQ